MKNKGCSVIVLVATALVFFGISLALLLFLAPTQRKLANQIANLPELNAAEFQSAAPDTDIVITGIMEGNQEFATPKGYVIYRVQEWDVTHDSEDGYEGDWDTVERHFPPLKLKLEDGTVEILSVDRAEIGGKQHSEIVMRSNSDQIVNNIPEGSIRHVGYKDGEQITVVGQKDEPGSDLRPREFYGGNRAELVKSIEGEASFVKWLGFGLGFFGFVVLAIAVVRLIRPR